MGRTSDYTKQVRNEECENTVETKKSSRACLKNILNCLF